jgi:porin
MQKPRTVNGYFRTLKSIQSRYFILLFGLLFLLAVNPSGVFAQEQNAVARQDTTTGRPSLLGPADANNQLKADEEVTNPTIKKDFIDRAVEAKNAFYEKTGFKIGLDYNSLYLGATESLGKKNAASGVFRLYGKWDFVGRGTGHTGGLVYKIEHRHRYTDVPPSDFGFEMGYVGMPQPLFNNQGFRVTNLYWRQAFANQQVVGYFGFLDVTDWTDVYALASPWESYNNLAFSVGSSTIGGLPDGSFGGMLSAWLSDRVYAIASITDANARATEVFKGFDTFFSDFQTFKTVEVGIIKSKQTAFVNNFHVTLWQIDQSNVYQTPSGWGISASGTVLLGNQFEPFLRGGWSKDGGSLYEASVSTGLGYYLGSHVLGLGLNWSRPNENTFGAKLDDQFTSEVFFKWQVAHQLQISPSLQFIGNPALNPDTEFIALFGLRTRFFL